MPNSFLVRNPLKITFKYNNKSTNTKPHINIDGSFHSFIHSYIHRWYLSKRKVSQHFSCLMKKSVFVTWKRMFHYIKTLKSFKFWILGSRLSSVTLYCIILIQVDFAKRFNSIKYEKSSCWIIQFWLNIIINYKSKITINNFLLYLTLVKNLEVYFFFIVLLFISH